MTKLLTDNSTGLAIDRQIFIKEQLKSVDILFLQEHWLLDLLLANSRLLTMLCAFTGVDSHHEILSGRPYVGCAIFCDKTLKNIEPVILTSKRICAMLRKDDNIVALMVNSYLPYDSGGINLSGEDNVIKVLNKIKVLLQLHNPDNIVWGGDLNLDFA